MSSDHKTAPFHNSMTTPNMLALALRALRQDCPAAPSDDLAERLHNEALACAAARRRAALVRRSVLATAACLVLCLGVAAHVFPERFRHAEPALECGLAANDIPANEAVQEADALQTEFLNTEDIALAEYCLQLGIDLAGVDAYDLLCGEFWE